MKQEHPFETKMRLSKFPSETAAQDAIKGDALTPGYLFDLLCGRRFLELRADGTVVGVPRPVRKEPTAAKEWGDTWPSREKLLNAVKGMESCTLTDLKDHLSAIDEPAGHWAIQHAMRVLIAEGLAKKDGRHYVYIPPKPDAAPEFES